MTRVFRSRGLTSAAAATTALLAACGGGGGSDPVGTTGTLRLSLTDAPACGYDNVFVTVEKVRVHKSGSAGDADSGWSEVVLATPQRVDLLTLNNGTLLPLGQTALPAGTYNQLRLVLAANTAASPFANSIKPTGGVETALTTPSGQQSGLKANINIDVPADKIADFAIDFDACKSFVKAGNSGKYLLKPVLSVIPILSDAGQRIVGHLHPSLVAPGTTVSAQLAGVPVRATPPDATGQFVLYPVPTGSYDLVITAAGRVNAVMTGVPVVTTAFTTIGSTTARINTPPSANSYSVAGTITVTPPGGAASSANNGGVVRATQTLTGGPTIETASVNVDDLDGSYSLLLPAGAPLKLAYAAGATTFTFAGDITDAGKYKLSATATGFVTPKTFDLPLAAVNPPVNFAFP